MMQSGKRSGTVLFALLLASVLSLIASPDSQGQSSEAPTPPERTPQADEHRQPSVPPGLLQKAEREGSVLVTVGLRSDFVPEGRLSRSGITDQRDRIKSAQAGLRNDLQGTGYQTMREYDTIPYISLELPPRAVQAIQQSPRVSSIEEERPIPAALAQSAPKVQAPTMWSSGYTGTGNTVAVLDSGVQSSHPFLANKVVEEACFSYGSNCPGGTQTKVGAGSGGPCAYAVNGCKHGTHVAGIAAGRAADFSGVAKGADVMSVQVFSKATGAACAKAGEDPCALSYPADQKAGLDLVNKLSATRKFSSVNISIGGGQYFGTCDAEYPAMKALIDSLRSKGIPTVIASGNDSYTNSMAFPACISSAISVGNTTKSDTIAYDSNSASFLSLLAPGSAISSSLPGGTYGAMSGTSMAAPHVAGAWALVKQKNPSATVDSVLSTLQNTGTAVKDTRAAGGVTKRRINIADAAQVTPKGTVQINAGAFSTRYTTVKLSVAASSGVSQMRFHNDLGNWTAWEPYATTKTWTIRNAQGERTVYAQFKDRAGIVSPETAIKDTIMFDTVGPRVISSDPVFGAHITDMAKSAKITFNEHMNAASLESNVIIRKLNKDGTYTSVTADVTYYRSSNTAVLNPVNNLARGSTYVISVLGGALDAAGNEIDQYPDRTGTEGHFWRLYTD